MVHQNGDRRAVNEGLAVQQKAVNYSGSHAKGKHTHEQTQHPVNQEESRGDLELGKVFEQVRQVLLKRLFKEKNPQLAISHISSYQVQEVVGMHQVAHT